MIWRAVRPRGARALFQIQEDMKKQLSTEGKYTEEELEEYMNSHKKLMIDSLWKLNVADIEAQKFPKADPMALRLLEKLIAFDPADRISTEEALADPYFYGLANQLISKLEFER
ncbi:hypothetical protein CTI12_AA085200 [Artemisia annua]|uniref:Uncharacterized protein n=1 Tax=Artemisia annua TaxID=35608 RepID=A0A2U1PZX8_ARTAN|nr:hypothetical protein CTI12_AA085200 [Artemisia annua]